MMASFNIIYTTDDARDDVTWPHLLQVQGEAQPPWQASLKKVRRGEMKRLILILLAV